MATSRGTPRFVGARGWWQTPPRVGALTRTQARCLLLMSLAVGGWGEPFGRDGEGGPPRKAASLPDAPSRRLPGGGGGSLRRHPAEDRRLLGGVGHHRDADVVRAPHPAGGHRLRQRGDLATD